MSSTYKVIIKGIKKECYDYMIRYPSKGVFHPLDLQSPYNYFTDVGDLTYESALQKALVESERNQWKYLVCKLISAVDGH